MRRADGIALGALAGLAMAGPWLVPVGVRELEPGLAASLAWQRGGGGAWSYVIEEVVTIREDGGVVLEMPEVEPPAVSAVDPWGLPFRWTPQPGVMVFGSSSLSALIGSPVVMTVASFGLPSRAPLFVSDPAEWPGWKRLPAERPIAATAALVALLAVAWRVVRVRSRSRWVDAALAGVVALPFAALGWALAHTDRVASLLGAGSLVAVPAPVAAALSLGGLAFLVAGGLRLSLRR